MITTANILDIVTFAVLSLGFLISITIFILTCIYYRPLTSNVPILLILSTYLISMIFSLNALEAHVRTVYNELHPSSSNESRWCHISFYFLLVWGCAQLYSYTLQTLFRLFRVVFYKRKVLQSLRFFLILIIIKWLVSFLIPLPFLLLNYIEYVPKAYNCEIPVNNMRYFLMITFSIYWVPITVMQIIYAYIVRYIRRTTNMQQYRQNANKRDAIVLKRILILCIFMSLLSLPTIIIAIYSWFTQYLIPIAYNVNHLSLSLAIMCQPIMLGFITPQIRNIFKRNRIHVQFVAAARAI